MYFAKLNTHFPKSFMYVMWICTKKVFHIYKISVRVWFLTFGHYLISCSYDREWYFALEVWACRGEMAWPDRVVPRHVDAHGRIATRTKQHTWARGQEFVTESEWGSPLDHVLRPSNVQDTTSVWAWLRLMWVGAFGQRLMPNT